MGRTGFYMGRSGESWEGLEWWRDMVVFSFKKALSVGNGFQWDQGRGLGRSLGLTLKNMDREEAKVEAGRPLRRLLELLEMLGA